jgi:hypothetical protein
MLWLDPLFHFILTMLKKPDSTTGRIEALCVVTSRRDLGTRGYAMKGQKASAVYRPVRIHISVNTSYERCSS